MTDAPLYLAEWENRAIECLQPLAVCRSTVCFPFFANTLPLAFHYQLACQRAGAEVASIDERIQLYEWGQQRGILQKHLETDQSSPLVCYASAVEIQDLATVLRVDLGTYTPGSVFTDMRLALWRKRLALTENGGHPELIEFSQIAPFIAESCAHVEVFSDITPQAKALLEQPFNVGVGRGPVVHFVGDGMASLFDDRHVSGQSVRVFLYGGPMTLYMRRKRTRYIPFAISAQHLGAQFQTVVAISAKDDARRAIHDAVERYHTLLGDAAATELNAPNSEVAGFRAIQYYYNRLARMLAHRSSFPSSLEYARCIVEHKAGV